MTGDASVIALDNLWSGDIADRGDLLDIVFGWTDFAMLRRLVTKACAAAGLSGTRLDDFVLAVHEISANAILHAGAAGRLILQRAAHGIRALIVDTVPKPAGCPAPGAADMREPGDPGEAAGSDSGRGLWLAATLADELSITSGPDGTVVALYMRVDEPGP
jgi:serine/threonine-protein kinase RsbW